MKIIRSCEECPAEKYNPPSSWDWYCKFSIKLGRKPFIGIHPNCPLQDAIQPAANAADADNRPCCECGCPPDMAHDPECSWWKLRR